MRLNETDYYQFIRLHHGLLLHAGQKNGLVPKGMKVDDFIKAKDIQLKLKCRNALLEKLTFIDSFIKENPSKLSDEDLEIASGFQHLLSGKFFIYKYLKEHTIFIQDEFAYGVLALNDTFEEVSRYTPLPIMVEAVLLPFKGKIIYDGMLQFYNVRFGGGLRSSMNETYRQSKAKYGIITSLPFAGKEAWAGKSHSEQLGYFMGTKANREEFEDKIEALLRLHPKLLPEYHQAWGKIHAAQYKRNFKKLNLSKAWFAILEGQLISSAMAKKDLEENLHALVPKEKQKWVFVFKM